MIGDFQEALKLKRGSEVMARAVRLRVTHTILNQGGGSGMGEYPRSMTVVLEDGSVWSWDEWTPPQLQPKMLANNFRTEESGF